MKKLSRNLIRYFLILLLVIWMIVIFMFSAQQSQQSSNMSGGVSYKIVTICEGIVGKTFDGDEKARIISKINYPIRKIAHMTEYAILACLMMSVLISYGINERKRVELISIIFTFLYACTDEFHQLFVPGREGKFLDVMIDTCGATAGVLVLTFLIYLFEKNKRKR
ncbi:MAG: VanZ family protein [Agathobacter sp.]|nr:VanZ family protein [Agathobacter sp.]